MYLKLSFIFHWIIICIVMSFRHHFTIKRQPQHKHILSTRDPHISTLQQNTLFYVIYLYCSFVSCDIVNYQPQTQPQTFPHKWLLVFYFYFINFLFLQSKRLIPNNKPYSRQSAVDGSSRESAVWESEKLLQIVR